LVRFGFDGDPALWDPNLKETINEDILHRGTDYPSWEVSEVIGWPVMIIVKETLAVQDSKTVCFKGKEPIIQ
jgi:dihydroorotase-like cyclic amidohydrolase